MNGMPNEARLDDEAMRQRNYMESVRALARRPRFYTIETYGCQMNVRDSQTLAGMLEAMGLTRVADRADADMVLYNTCCVRDNAERRTLGNVGWLRELKRTKPSLVIAVCGCMMQQPGAAESLMRRYKFIDLCFGTGNLHRLPELLHTALTSRAPVCEVLPIGESIHEGMPVARGCERLAYVNVMYGCDNFCSYCIVPFVRGRERSRHMDQIEREVAELMATGTLEVMLLGQNVNSYRGEAGEDFAELLRRIDATGIPRLRFMTSHPKDLSDSLIAAMAELPSVCPHIHLPVQSGNDEILALMNRKYTRGHYLELIDKLRARVPGIGITTDIIVGFPGETDAQFEDTLSLIKQARFDSAYTFLYSPRRGTRAFEMGDVVPEVVKKQRITALIDAQARVTMEIFRAQIGMRWPVLVEGVSARSEAHLMGKTPRGLAVNFAGAHERIGTITDITITSAGKNTLRGETAPPLAPAATERGAE